MQPVDPLFLAGKEEIWSINFPSSCMYLEKKWSDISTSEIVGWFHGKISTYLTFSHISRPSDGITVDIRMRKFTLNHWGLWWHYVERHFWIRIKICICIVYIPKISDIFCTENILPAANLMTPSNLFVKSNRDMAVEEVKLWAPFWMPLKILPSFWYCSTG